MSSVTMLLKRANNCFYCNLFGYWEENNAIDEQLVEGFLAPLSRGGLTFLQLARDINHTWRVGIPESDTRLASFVPGPLSFLAHREDKAGERKYATVDPRRLEEVLDSLRRQGHVIQAKADVRDDETGTVSKQRTWARLCTPRMPPQEANPKWDDLEDLGPQRLKFEGSWRVHGGPCRD